MRFWLLFVALFPLLLWQGIRTRKTAIRLPEATGETSGTVGQHYSGKTLRLHIVGESPVAGVGVATHQDGIGPALAKVIANQLQRPVQCQVNGENGAPLATLLTTLPPPARCDLTLIMIGVNDTTRLTSRQQWRLQLLALYRRLSAQGPVGFFTLPPVGDFSALPQPLRYVIGQRAQQLNRDLQNFCQTHRLPFISYQSPATAQYLAEDGYHPSAAGYHAIAEQVGAQLIKLFAKPC